VRVIIGQAERGPIVSATIAMASLVMLGLTTAAGLPTVEVAMAIGLLVILALGYRTLLRWHVLLIFMFLVIMFIPIKRYELPGNLPFDMEPYRVSVMLVIACWVTSLLVDPRTRLRTSGIEGPLALIWFSAMASVVFNGDRIDRLAVGPEVLKGLMFLLSFLLVFYLIVSVVRTFEHVHALVQVLVLAGAVVAFFGVIEAWTGFNIFDRLADVMPFLSLKEDVNIIDKSSRGGRLRVFASSQGPISLSAALVMLIPLAFYLARGPNRRIIWWPAAGVILLGALSTGSRTAVVMFIAVFFVFLWLRPVQTRRALVVLLLPVLVAVQIVLPGTIGTLRSSFFPEGGLIAQQSENAGTRGSGRLADVGPALDEYVATPLFGQGYGTRVTGRDPRANALILDNQWLKTLLEVGAVGVFAWIWLFVRFARRLGPEAKADEGERGWLLVACVASVLGFALGMFFFDAFSFIQVTFLLYIIMALGMVLVAGPLREPRRRRTAPAARRPVRAMRPAPRPAGLTR
jgi:polysaccharide biosynthesis protein PslJ